MNAELPNRLRSQRCKSLPLVVFLAFIDSPVLADSFAVDTTADAQDSIPGDGICATSAGTCSLRAAVEETNALPGDDLINVPAGTYLITLGNGDDDAERGDFDVVDTLSIVGAGRLATIIDGNDIDRAFDVREDGTLNLSRVTIRNGDENQGAGIRNANDLVLSDVAFTNNVAKDGGGVYVHKNGSMLTIDNVSFATNSANKGAALYAKDNSIVSISNSSFDSNISNDPGVETKDGGGVYIDKANASISGSRFTNNVAAKGGGLFAKGNATVSIVDSLFGSNSVTKEGGGIYFDKVIATISETVLHSNSASEGGGVFVKGGGTDVTLENVTLSDNAGFEEGGGIQKEGNGQARLVNVTVYGNRSPRGSGLRRKDGTVTVVNSIIANNLQDADCDGGMTSQGHNLDSDGSCQLGQPGDLPGMDPVVGPLQDNGGSTLTHALQETSPARDTATNASCPATDQRGVARPIDGDGNGIADCDIGAYEAPSPQPSYELGKAAMTVSDPVSGNTNPKAIPGAIIEYRISLSNDGPGAADQDSITITDPVPADTSLVVADFDAANPGPVAFVDGIPASGLSYTFLGLGNSSDDIEFSDDGGSSYGYEPSPGADGSDPNVTHLRIRPAGTAVFTGADPVAQFLLKVIVR